MTAVAAGRWAAARVRAGPLLRALALGIAAAPLVAWPVSLASEPVQPPPWRTRPDIARDIATVRDHVRPGEDVLLLPPRRNELHLLLGTRARSYEQGYWWVPAPGMTVRAVRSAGLDAVIVVRGALDATDRMVWDRLECDAALRELPRAGFTPVVELPTMTVWRRR